MQPPHANVAYGQPGMPMGVSVGQPMMGHGAVIVVTGKGQAWPHII